MKLNWNKFLFQLPSTLYAAETKKIAVSYKIYTTQLNSSLLGKGSRVAKTNTVYKNNSKESKMHQSITVDFHVKWIILSQKFSQDPVVFRQGPV